MIYSVSFIYDDTHFKDSSPKYEKICWTRAYLFVKLTKDMVLFEYHVENIPTQWKFDKIHITIMFCQTTNFLKWSPGPYTLETNWLSLISSNHSFFPKIYRPDTKSFLILFNSLRKRRQNKFNKIWQYSMLSKYMVSNEIVKS